MSIRRSALGLTLALVLTASVSAGSVAAQGSSAAPVEPNRALSVNVIGLEKGDEADLSLSVIGDSDGVLQSQSVLGDGAKTALSFSADLKDGNYQLLISAPDKYFREPRGYFFTVHESKVVNLDEKTIEFKLVPPSGRDYLPYRGPVFIADPAAEGPLKETAAQDSLPYRAETIFGISMPAKQGEPEVPDTTDSIGYHYTGPYTTHDNDGVQARFSVADTGVRHGTWPDTEFVSDRVYANRVVGGQQHWIETGWVEHSWLTDDRYLYEFDNTLLNQWPWHFIFTVPDGTNIEVRVRNYSGNYWVSEYWNGSYWVQTSYVDVGFSNADNGYNRGEVYTWDGNHPYVPIITTSAAYLNISGTWTLWDYGTFWLWTRLTDAPPYDAHYTALYYNFYWHTH